MTMTPTAQLGATLAPHAPALVIEEVYGSRSLTALHLELAELAQRCQAPMTARGTWVYAAVEVTPELRLWAVLARNASGVLVGAVVLQDRADGLTETVTLAGTDDGQRGAILTRYVTVARTLGLAVSRALDRRALDRRVLSPAVALEPLPANSPIVRAFAVGLYGCLRVDLAGVPVIRRTDAEAGAYLSHGMRRTLRKARNRLEHDQLSATIQFTTDAGRIKGRLPELELCHRSRDHVQGRQSDLDDDVQRRLWRRRIHSLACAGVLELATIYINGEFAAYTLGAVDGSVYRLIEGRLATVWSRYSPGRLLEAAVVQRMFDDPRFDTFDWMTSVASDSLLGYNDADPMVALRRAGGQLG